MKVIWWRIERPGMVDAGTMDWGPTTPDAVISLGERSFPVASSPEPTYSLLERFLQWADNGDHEN